MWDDRYKNEDFAYGKEPNDFLREEFTRIPAGGHVLCLAEGEGRNAVFLAEQGYQVTAIDLSEVGLKKAQQLAKEKGVNISTQVADLAKYPLEIDSWDGIVSIWAHVPESIRQQVHAQVAHALKPEGIFLLEAYTYQQTKMEAVGGPSAEQQDRFGSLMNLRLELVELEEVLGVEKRRIVSEGARHQGLSAVVQFIGKKIS